MEKYFEAKYHLYPYVLKYTKKRESKKLPPHIITLDYSDVKIPVKEGKLIVEYPVDRGIKERVKNISSNQVDTVDQVVYHTYTYSHRPSLVEERFKSVNTGNAPQIIVAPIEFKYGVSGMNENWESFGKWIYNLNRGRDILPLSEKNKIDHLIENEKDKYDQIKVLYEYLQDNTRYINVSVQTGGLQTHPAEYVANNKYGDCKALTNYMQSMLKHIGVESYYTLIYNDDVVYDLDDFFSYNAFNHVILSVPMDNDMMFLECTSKNTPMGYVGTSNQGRKVLLVKENGSELIDISQLKPEDILCSRVLDISILDDGGADLTLDARMRGDEYEILNSYKERASRNVLDHFIRQNVLDGSFDISDYKMTKTSRDSAHIDLRIDCTMSNVSKKYGKNLVISPFPILLPKFEVPDKRTQDLQLDYPIYKKDKLIIHLKNSEILKIPSDIKITSSFGDYYTVQYTQENGNITVEKELLITSKRLEVDKYEDFYSFITSVKNNEVSNFYFEIL